jgi:hypothetical protein
MAREKKGKSESGDIIDKQWLQERCKYEGNSVSKLQIQVATYVFELSAGNCRR